MAKQQRMEGKRATRRRKKARSDRQEFTTGQRGPAEEVIALQQRVGNRAVRHLLGPHPVTPPAPMVMRAGLLNAVAADQAVFYNRGRYDSRSVRIIQIITSASVDGTFGRATAEQVAVFQDANPPLAVDGKVGENTLNVIVPERVAAGFQEHAIQLVADFYDLNTTRDTLTVHFDAGQLTPSETTFGSGNLRVIEVGPVAFTSATSLRDAIQAGLAEAAPAQAPVGPRPTRLTPAQEQRAIMFNRTTYTDRRSVLGIQGVVGTGFDADFGPDTAERIAEFQASHGIGVDGMVGEQTMGEMLPVLVANNQQDAAIRMVMDLFNLSEHNALLDITFDASVTDFAITAGNLPGPSIIQVGPDAFTGGLALLAHTLAHELEHVRQRREGVPSRQVREFLSYTLEIFSVGLPEHRVADFMDAARNALNFWNAMAPGDQTANAARFEQARRRVNERFLNFTLAEQAAHQATIDAYNAVVVPVPVP